MDYPLDTEIFPPLGISPLDTSQFLDLNKCLGHSWALPLPLSSCGLSRAPVCEVPFLSKDLWLSVQLKLMSQLELLFCCHHHLEQLLTL